MGANEKYAATYHGGEYVPIQGNMIRVNDGKGNELFSILSDGTVRGELEHTSQAAKIFMSELRGLTEIIRAEAKAEALRDAADTLNPELINYRRDAMEALSQPIRPAGGDSTMSLQLALVAANRTAVWLRDRANQYKETPDA